MGFNAATDRDPPFEVDNTIIDLIKHGHKEQMEHAERLRDFESIPMHYHRTCAWWQAYQGRF